MKFAKQIELGDPSTNKQNFINIKLKLLCCRYWSLDLWDCHDMVFPFWRIYWNKNEGGELKHQEEIYKMDPNYIYIIAPFTSFSSRFTKQWVSIVITSGIMRAKGLSTRSFRLRNSSTALRFKASQAR